MVPTEAVIQTGTRSIVMLAQGDGKFVAVDVEIGAEANGQTEIRKGLNAGQTVVISGQFLIDSEASLKGTTTRMGDMPAQQQSNQASGSTHRGKGTIERVYKDEVIISHGPIPALQWGAMTMGFKVPAKGLPKNVAHGDSVSFEFRPLNDGVFEITAISPITDASVAEAKGKVMDSPTKGEMTMPTDKAGAVK